VTIILFTTKAIVIVAKSTGTATTGYHFRDAVKVVIPKTDLYKVINFLKLAFFIGAETYSDEAKR